MSFYLQSSRNLKIHHEEHEEHEEKSAFFRLRGLRVLRGDPGLHDLQLHSHLLMVICLREWRNQRKRMTRNGKIARLPAALREELNQRLLNGEQGQPWVEWLNSLPQVQSVLRAKFQGIPISEHIYAQRLKIEQNKHPQIDPPARTSGRSSTSQYKSVTSEYQ